MASIEDADGLPVKGMQGHFIEVKLTNPNEGLDEAEVIKTCRLAWYKRLYRFLLPCVKAAPSDDFLEFDEIVESTPKLKGKLRRFSKKLFCKSQKSKPSVDTFPHDVQVGSPQIDERVQGGTDIETIPDSWNRKFLKNIDKYFPKGKKSTLLPKRKHNSNKSEETPNKALVQLMGSALRKNFHETIDKFFLRRSAAPNKGGKKERGQKYVAPPMVFMPRSPDQSTSMNGAAPRNASPTGSSYSQQCDYSGPSSSWKTIELTHHKSEPAPAPGHHGDAEQHVSGFTRGADSDMATPRRETTVDVDPTTVGDQISHGEDPTSGKACDGSDDSEAEIDPEEQGNGNKVNMLNRVAPHPYSYENRVTTTAIWDYIDYAAAVAPVDVEVPQGRSYNVLPPIGGTENRRVPEWSELQEKEEEEELVFWTEKKPTLLPPIPSIHPSLLDEESDEDDYDEELLALVEKIPKPLPPITPKTKPTW